MSNASEIHDISAKEKFDRFDSMAAVVQLSKMGRGSVGGSKKWVRLRDLMRSRTATYGIYRAVVVLNGYAKLARCGLEVSLVPLAELEEAIERVPGSIGYEP